MALKIDAKSEGKLTYVFQNDMRNLTNSHKLKYSDFNFDSIMAELNENKNSKRLDWADAVRRLCFTLEISE